MFPGSVAARGAGSKRVCCVCLPSTHLFICAAGRGRGVAAGRRRAAAALPRRGEHRCCWLPTQPPNHGAWLAPLSSTGLLAAWLPCCVYCHNAGGTCSTNLHFLLANYLAPQVVERLSDGTGNFSAERMLQVRAQPVCAWGFAGAVTAPCRWLQRRGEMPTQVVLTCQLSMLH